MLAVNIHAIGGSESEKKTDYEFTPRPPPPARSPTHPIHELVQFGRSTSKRDLPTASALSDYSTPHSRLAPISSKDPLLACRFSLKMRTSHSVIALRPNHPRVPGKYELEVQEGSIDTMTAVMAAAARQAQDLVPEEHPFGLPYSGRHFSEMGGRPTWFGQEVFLLNKVNCRSNLMFPTRPKHRIQADFRKETLVEKVGESGPPPAKLTSVAIMAIRTQ